MVTHIELRSVSKSYGGVLAASDVSFSIARGSVHAIVGENGAGKSTVSKMIAGVVPPTSGDLVVSGEVVRFASPRQARAAGIAMIDQELSMVPAQSVIENIFLGSESLRGPLLSRRAQRKRFAQLIERTGFDLDPDVRVGTLRIADQQKVEILRAIARDAELIIMDEPTAPLTPVEAEQLYAIVRSLRDGGTTIVYISHFLREVLQVSDTVTVMRDGRHVRTAPSSEETEASLVEGMLGRPMALEFPDRNPCDESVEPAFEVRNLSAAGRFSDISFTLRPGEIVGLAGLIGSGRSEVLRAVFGADPVDSGTILVGGEPVRMTSPHRAISHSIGLLPESRKDDGLVMRRSIAENMVMSDLDRVSSYGLIRRRRQRSTVGSMMAALDVRARGQEVPVWRLSGGNQQKVLFGKCLVGHPDVLLIDEPTRGVDVAAKSAIYELLVSLAASGMALLMVSSEIEEVLGLSHRLLVMRRGRLVAEMRSDETDKHAVLAAAFGASRTVP